MYMYTCVCLYICTYKPWQRLEDNEKLICIDVQVCVHVCLYTYTPWQRLENNEKNDIIEKNFNVQ